jgi:hypothetical protein
VLFTKHEKFPVEYRFFIHTTVARKTVNDTTDNKRKKTFEFPFGNEIKRMK